MSQQPRAPQHPPKPRLTVRVGITGHRPNKLSEAAAARVERQLSAVYRAIQETADKVLREDAGAYAKESAVIRLLSGFAEGADQMAVRLCPSAWQVEALLPFPRDEYIKDFQQSAVGNGRDVSDAFLACLKRANTVTELPMPKPEERDKGYADAGGYLLRQIDVLIAVWDGQPPRPGGTGAIAREAFEGGIPVVWISTTGDPPPRLIANFDGDGDPEAPDADCTDGPLAKALVPIFAPPAPETNGKSRGSPRDGLDRFLAEGWRGSFYLSAFDLLKQVASWQWPRAVIRYRSFEARMREWDGFIAEAPDAENLRQRLVATLLPRFIWADTLAVHFSHLYRSAYVSAYLFSAVAVFIALLGVFFDNGPDPLRTKAILVGFELVVIGLILGMVLIGRYWLWHERWLDYRALAENLRHGRFLSFVSEFGRISGAASEGERQPPWILWYIRATMREIGLPNRQLDATYQWRLLDATLADEIEGPQGQLAYHRGNCASAHRIDHRLHLSGMICFFATAAMLAAFLASYLLGYGTQAPAAAAEHAGHAESLLMRLKPWVTFFVAGLPALGAALAGIRVQGDFEGSRERSEQMIKLLEELAQDYKTAESRKITLEETAKLLIDTAQTMSEDVESWQELYGRKRLTLPA